MKTPKMKKLPMYHEGGNIDAPMSMDRDERPTIEIDETELPEVADWKTGETYTVTLEVTQVSSKVIEYGSKKGKIEACFKIVKAMSHDSGEEEEEFEGYAAGGTVSAEKAKIMLKDNQANGKKLSPRQKRYFGWIAGGSKQKLAMGGPVLNANSGEKMHNAMSGVPFEKMNKWEEATRGEVKGTEKLDNTRSTKVVTDDQVYKEGYAKGGEVKKKKTIRGHNAMSGAMIEKIK